MTENEPVYPGLSWEVLREVEAAGFTRAGLDQVAAAARSLPTTALMVVAGGRVVLEYGDTSRICYLASARKSVLSVLFGGPVTDGVIKLESTLGELGVDDVGGLLAIERQASIGDLLTARSGVYHSASSPGGDVRNVPPRGSRRPGTQFLYNNWDFNVLGTLFERLTRRGVFDALRDDIATPLGFQDFDGDRQRLLGLPERSRHLAHHMFLSARDLARIGLLMVRRGRWRDVQVVPHEWVTRSTSVEVDLGADSPMDYGYLWWLPRGYQPAWQGAFLAAGNFGQYLLGLPSLDLVVVHRYAVPDAMAIARNQAVGADLGPVPDRVTAARFLQLAQAVLDARCGAGTALA